jgi:hypothetical protein
LFTSLYRNRVEGRDGKIDGKQWNSEEIFFRISEHKHPFFQLGQSSYTRGGKPVSKFSITMKKRRKVWNVMETNSLIGRLVYLLMLNESSTTRVNLQTA